MPAEPLTLAANLTDRTRSLHDGTVRPEGIDLNVVALEIEEIFWRMLRYQEFDAAEMSMSSYLLTRDRGDPAFVAIPVFPSRSFRHNGIFVNADAGIESPEDLRGKPVGVPEYQMTAPLWIRGLLQHEYGVAPTDMDWYQGGQEQAGREEKVEPDLHIDLEVSAIPADDTLSAMLGRGDLAALFSPRIPSTYDGATVKRLFPNYREAEWNYYDRTGHFPIMHTVVLRQDVYDERPWVAQELTKAFTAAKDHCLDRIGHTHALQTSLPWVRYELDATRELMGEDFWSYGIADNRDTLETMVQYSHEQGLISEEMAVEDLFAPETFEAFKI